MISFAGYRLTLSQRGSAMVEYMVVATALVAALFLEFEDGRSVVQMLTTSLVNYVQSLSFVVSLP
jgi:Flp pilus assembly protein TadG